MMTMRELTYQVSFNTPAFLGNAEQQAQWRTPPFKALLRQWWRVVKAQKVGYDHKRLLAAENALFGSALDGEGSSRSKVQLRLSAWDGQVQDMVSKGEQIDHPESPTKKVGANTYLGYGPIGAGADRSALVANGDSLSLSLRLPTEFESEVRDAMHLAHWFGALGSRSRNGWGAVNVRLKSDGKLVSRKLTADALLKMAVVQSVDACLSRDWPHAVGIRKDGALAVWLLEGHLQNGFSKWEDAMLQLAKIKVAVRTSPFFDFGGGGKGGHDAPTPRHLLSYPSGNSHVVTPWGKDARMANQIRFKVHKRPDGKFTAVIVHLPCAVPEPLASKVKFGMPDQKAIWAEAHRLLDAQSVNGLIRLPRAI